MSTRRNLFRVSARLAFLSLLGVSQATLAAEIPSPLRWFGFRMGEDFRLVTWPKVVDYTQAVDRASERVAVLRLGESTEGRPFLVAVVSSPETITQLDTFRGYQKLIADPRKVGAEGLSFLARSKPVVLITCSIHSSETASTHTAMELLHDLATKDDPTTREILDKVILLLVPSINPDGVDKVAAWYERSRGKPWEGGGMPELYHKYAGHDTNRDWFMLNLRETQLMTRLLYRDWFPTLAYDIHQMGSKGARIFVPPFFDPINPNLDPRVNQGISNVGSHMAADLAAAGRKGVLTNAMYDNWWNGGNRTVPQRHNIVAVLTESASVRLASPIFVEKSELRGGSRGFADHRAAVNFVTPWPGGWWRLRDIVEDQLICCRSILTYAARYGPTLQANYLQMGRDAITRGSTEPPYAWIVPADQRDLATATRMVRILRETGIDVLRASKAFEADGAAFPAGSFILPAAQPYRAHLKDMMERQIYPDRFTPNGQAEAPYDVAGWTLPLQMGVRAVSIRGTFLAQMDELETIEVPEPEVVGGAADTYRLALRSVDDNKALNALLAQGAEATLDFRPDAPAEDLDRASIRIRPAKTGDKPLLKVLEGTSSRLNAIIEPEMPEQPGAPAQRAIHLNLKAPRVGVYKPWIPSLDEGWTRLVLETAGFRPTTLENASIRVGELRQRYDAIILPSVDPGTIRDGWGPDETEPAFVGGLGAEGRVALVAFVEEGGTLICLEGSCQYAIDAFSLPVVDVLKGLKSSEFYGPGSILGIVATTTDPLMAGFPARGSAYFDRSHAFEVQSEMVPRSDPPPTIVARYASTDVLESGWLLGAGRLQGKAAIVEAKRGDGRILLFGFPPQHRGQTYGTFRLLFNAIFQASVASKGSG
ncbi:M14 family metallopeptidase [Isosphaeraceae bacterium EP7]